MDNPATFCCLTQNVGRLVFPICSRLHHECNQAMLVFATVDLEAGVEPYDLGTILSDGISFLLLPTVENKCLKAAGKCALEVSQSSHV